VADVGEKGAEEDIWAERDEVTGEWIKLHNEELTDLYSSPSVIWASISGRIL